MYRVIHETTVTGKIQYSASGPGILYSKPWFEKESDAETLCRNLAQAFGAGEQARSEELLRLLESGRRR